MKISQNIKLVEKRRRESTSVVKEVTMYIAQLGDKLAS